LSTRNTTASDAGRSTLLGIADKHSCRALVAPPRDQQSRVNRLHPNTAKTIAVLEG
jgi:hypothetical protein